MHSRGAGCTQNVLSRIAENLVNSLTSAVVGSRTKWTSPEPHGEFPDCHDDGGRRLLHRRAGRTTGAMSPPMMSTLTETSVIVPASGGLLDAPSSDAGGTDQNTGSSTQASHLATDESPWFTGLSGSSNFACLFINSGDVGHGRTQDHSPGRRDSQPQQRPSLRHQWGFASPRPASSQHKEAP